MHYIKQYGARRTGTNYLRALLEQNFTDVTVLMHTLGGKHGVPVDLGTLLPEYTGNPVGFVQAATAAVPAENSLPFSNEQLMFMDTHSTALTDAVSQQQLRYLISVKNPYAWINSMFKNVLYRRPEATEQMKAKLYQLTKAQCIEYNTLYLAYLEHFQKLPEQTIIIRYEDLIKNREDILNTIKDTFYLNPASGSFSNIDTTAMPTDWDQVKSISQIHHKEFDRDYYLQQDYLNDLGPEMTAILEEEIDWALMKHFGYALCETAVSRPAYL